jgi:hypothetical protein
VSQHLFIVARQQLDLYSYLTREFSGEPDVQVILDRRRGERRRQADSHTADSHTMEGTDRRHAERRSDGEVGDQLSSLGYAFVRLA